MRLAWAKVCASARMLRALDRSPASFSTSPRLSSRGSLSASSSSDRCDRARWKALQITDYMRRHGPFEPHRLPLDEMEYTTMPKVVEKLKDRFVPLEGLEKDN